MKFLTKHAANDVSNNISGFFRKKRIKIFNDFINTFVVSDTIRILDIGGTNYFWNIWKEYIERDIKVTLINTNEQLTNGYDSLKLDANDLSSLKDKSFDIVFSNSLIEHLFTYENQKIFTEEILRIGKKIFIQTPAFIFPIEPHFLFPFFHWFNRKIRLSLVKHYNLGWYKKQSKLSDAEKLVDEIRIMKKKELIKLFPNENIFSEKLLLLTKSYIIYSRI